MNKKFDSVAFQRKRREALSRRILKLTPSQMVLLFNRKEKVDRNSPVKNYSRVETCR
jgi:hypothetical protein